MILKNPNWDSESTLCLETSWMLVHTYVCMLKTVIVVKGLDLPPRVMGVTMANLWDGTLMKGSTEYQLQTSIYFSSNKFNNIAGTPSGPWDFDGSRSLSKQVISQQNSMLG